MTHVYVGLVRAVNVGGTGKLPMQVLRSVCETAGFQDVRTYLASGNVVFRTALGEAAARRALETGLQRRVGKPVRVILRSAAEIAAAAEANPFPEAPGNRVAVIFLTSPVSGATLEGITGQSAGEMVQLGRHELYVHYPNGMGTSRLRIPGAERGTARNMNTVTRLAAMAAE